MEKQMTVRDLIKALQKKNQDAIVAVRTSNFEQGNAQIPASRLYEFKGTIKRENFRDAFDGGSYDKEIIKWDEKGEIDFIEIN